MNPSFCKQMLQEDRTSVTFIVKHRRFSSLNHVCYHDVLPTIMQQGTVDVVVTEEDCINHGGTIWRGQSLFLCITDDYATITVHERRLGVMGISSCIHFVILMRTFT